MQVPTELCRSSCEARALDCGADAPTAAAICAELCGRNPTADQLACLESLSCSGDPEECFASAACDDGEKRCQGDSVETCTAGSWTQSESCPAGCSAAMCVDDTFENPCAIPAEDLKVDTPHVSLSPPTIVFMRGGCSGSVNGQSYEGYDGAELLNILEDLTTTVTIDNIASLFFIQYDLRQREATSTEKSSLAQIVGFDPDLFQSSSTIRSAGGSSNVTFPDYTLPAGVSAQFFLPTSTQQDGVLRFSSTDSQALGQVLTDLDAGIGAILPVGLFSGSSTYDYTVTLRRTGTKLTIDAIQ